LHFHYLDKERGTDILHVVVARCSQHRNDPLNLIQEILPRKQRLPSKKFSQNAPNGPNIDGLGVFAGVEDDLGRPIPPGDHILGLFLFFLNIAPGQPKIADLEVTSFVLCV
jgi:hypothetical protein